MNEYLLKSCFAFYSEENNLLSSAAIEKDLFHYFEESNIFIISVRNLIELIKLITKESC